MNFKRACRDDGTPITGKAEPGRGGAWGTPGQAKGRDRTIEPARPLRFLPATVKLLDGPAELTYDPFMVMPHDAIALPAELEQRVRELAAETGRSPRQIMVAAIEGYVADLEDGRIAEARLKTLDAGEADTVSLETLLAEYGMAN